MNRKIKEVLDVYGFPVATNTYTGDEDIYFVMTINAFPDDFADDGPQHIKYLCSVHLYCPHTFNTMGIKRQIKKALHDAGFTYPTEIDASDETQHIVFEFEGADGG